MKKILIGLLICTLLCAFLFAACKNKEPAPTETDTSAVTETVSAPTTGKNETGSTTQEASTADDTQTEPAQTEEETDDGEDEESEENNTAKEFLGEYRNSDYTARVEQAPDGELTFTVTSAPDDDGVGYEWTITGFYSGDTYRVNYKDAVKTEISYDEDGEETGRETVYDNGIGRMQFTDDGALLWQNETEAAGGRIVLNRVEG